MTWYIFQKFWGLGRPPLPMSGEKNYGLPSYFQLVDIEQDGGGKKVSPLKGESDTPSQHLLDRDHSSTQSGSLLFLTPFAQSRPTSPSADALLSPINIFFHLW